MSRDADALAVRDDEAVATATSAKPTPPARKTGFAGLIQRITQSRPVRSFQHYTQEGGPLLSAGMSYNAVFATFAAIWVVFSVAGFIVAGDPNLQQAVFRGINRAVPNLIGENGIDPKSLTETGALSWTGAIALVGLLFTALGFLAAMRDGIRRIFDLPPESTNVVLQKLRDLGLALGFGVLVLLSTGISVLSTAALGAVFTFLGIDSESLFAQIVARTIGYLLVLAVDFVTVAAAFRILSAVRIPWRRLAVGAAIGAVGIGVLKAAFQLGLIGGVGSNPLLAGFAVIIGLLIFFNFFCQVLLISASWIDVGLTDAGITARSLDSVDSEVDTARKLEDARRLIADTDHKAAEAEYRRATGLRKRRLGRRILRDVRAEARRREAVPTTEELLAQKKAEKQAREKAEKARRHRR